MGFVELALQALRTSHLRQQLQDVARRRGLLGHWQSFSISTSVEPGWL
jgi:hypothetical protein